MFRRLIASLPTGRRSARRRPHSCVRLTVENLYERVVPAAYTWTGASMANQNWSTLENWSWDGPGNVPAPPGLVDDVTFDASAPVGKRGPIMDGDFTIKTLNVPVIAGGDYTLTFNGRLDVFGHGTSTIASGIIGDLGNGRIVFGPSDGSIFNWEGGRIANRVDVLAGTEFHLQEAGTKEVRGVINNYSVLSDWDGKGTFSLNLGQFNIKPGASFSVTAEGDATVNIVRDSTFSNEGTVSSNLPAGKVFGFPDPGRAVNFGTWNVLGGKAATRNFQNSGTINIAAGCRFEMGSGGGIVGQTYIDSTQAESGASAIQGEGKAVFTEGSTVNLSGASNQVQNVEDFAAKTMGNGNLSIIGDYSLGTYENPTSTEWTGGGITRLLKTPTGGGIMLIVGNLELSRQLVNDSALIWSSADPPAGGAPGLSTIVMKLGGSIWNSPGGEFAIGARGNTWMRMSGGGGATGLLANLGIIMTEGDANSLIEIDVPYQPFLAPPLVQMGVLSRISGPLKLGKKLIGHVGMIENAPGIGLVFADGIQMSDGEITNNGELEVINEFELAGGTVLSEGNGVDPASVLIDILTQTGGEIENRADWTVTDLYTLSAGSFTSELPGMGDAQVTVDRMAHSGGTVLSKAPWTVTDDLTLSANADFTQAGELGTTAPFLAGALTQTGGELLFVTSNDQSDFSVDGTFLFQGGSAEINQPNGTLPPGGTIDQLIVQAGGIISRGNFQAPMGILVAGSGALILGESSFVTGSAVNNGNLTISWTADLVGDLLNTGTVKLGLPGEYDPTNILTIFGNFTQVSGATLIMDLAAVGQSGGGSDKLQVTGTATLAGTLQLLIDPALTPSGTYTLVSYGSRSGQFQTIVPPSGASQPTAWYDNPTPGTMGVYW